jgi:hypothetical protein
VVLAMPVDGVVALLDRDLRAAAPALGRLSEAVSHDIGSLAVTFRGQIAGVPDGIVTLVDSRFGLTLVDNGQLWGLGTSLLNVVATDVTTFRDLDDRTLSQMILDELRRFVPFDPAEVVHVSYQTHVAQPLFAGTVGSWLLRPEVEGHVPGLYLCGDYCRSHVDVVCVEGAVTTASWRRTPAVVTCAASRASTCDGRPSSRGRSHVPEDRATADRGGANSLEPRRRRGSRPPRRQLIGSSGARRGTRGSRGACRGSGGNRGTTGTAVAARSPVVTVHDGRGVRQGLDARELVAVTASPDAREIRQSVEPDGPSGVGTVNPAPTDRSPHSGSPSPVRAWNEGLCIQLC